MGRPAKVGLSYYLLDCDFLRDRKLRHLKRKCGAGSQLVFIAVLAGIYSEKGYYAVLDDDFLDEVAENTGFDFDQINLVISEAVLVGLFDKAMFENDRVLTSVAVQKQYYETMNRLRKGKFSLDGEYVLITAKPEYPAEEHEYHAEEHEYHASEVHEKEKENRDRENNFPQKKKKGVKLTPTELVLLASERGYFSPPVMDAITLWCEYKSEQKFLYTPTGAKTLLTEIHNRVVEFGDKGVCDAIQHAIASGWTGIHYDALERRKYQNAEKDRRYPSRL